MVNGITELHMTKLDVLSYIDEVKVCTNYIINNESTTTIPYDLGVINEMDFKSFPSWKSLDNIDSFENLSMECKDYIKFIEDYLQVKIKTVSTGPDRLQIIEC